MNGCCPKLIADLFAVESLLDKKGNNKLVVEIVVVGDVPDAGLPPPIHVMLPAPLAA